MGNNQTGVGKPAREYEVGYKKPPQHTQFRKGQSGNPKGRPKGSRNGRTIIGELLKRKVTITENGQIRQVEFLEGLIHQIAATALKGNVRDQLQFFKLIEEYAPEELNGVDAPAVLTVQFVDSDGTALPNPMEMPNR